MKKLFSIIGLLALFGAVNATEQTDSIRRVNFDIRQRNDIRDTVPTFASRKVKHSTNNIHKAVRKNPKYKRSRAQ